MKLRKTYLSRGWQFNGLPSYLLSEEKMHVLKCIKEDIQSGKLQLVENHCLCGNNHEEKDWLIAEQESHGLPIPEVLCRKCGLIRSGLVFDDASNLKFYQDYYRGLYADGALDCFVERQEIGEALFKIFTEHVSLNQIADVCENGCGAGSVLMPFHRAGKKCIGYDYDVDYLQVGINNGLNLIEGDVVRLAEDDSFDLLILSHVMEHFLHPVEEMQQIIAKVRLNKYLLIQVPGIFSIKEDYGKDPMMHYFQNAHIYNFYEQYLRVFFKKLGLRIVYGDEKCTFILQREKAKAEAIKEIYDPSLKGNYRKVYYYLRKNLPCRNKTILTIKRLFYPLACFFGWRKWRNCFR